ncbi:E3 ubiquitin-protein ligase RNF14-like isoform X2 [Hippoglossus hippoglossus]|uniref:E3 ubiquitin-protein ligase RNF14-like isoform X2 n=1 Tax=Hippoglossus hippoglossus TaxID=8267 RepID=UPI00148D181D|nr:E3 ubiquitin-protein ligase RNF14-like isoform X2 [Hippoglossus hippoglossus]
MNSDLEEQEDELLALLSIFGPEEFVRNESSPAGEIRVSVELPADFTVALTEGGTVRQYELSSLPPLLLTFELPADYPSSSPPSFTLTCSWMILSQLSALCSQLTDLYQATGGAVVLFSWAQFLKEDALRFLEVHTHLELPSDDHSSQHFSLNSQNQNNGDTSESGVSAPPLEVIPAEGPNPPTSDWSSTDSQGAGALQESSSPSQHEFSEDSGPSDDSQPSARESEPSDQIQNGLSSEDNKTQPLPLADPDQNSEDSSNERDVSSLLPSGPSGEFDHIEQGASALPLHPREFVQNKEPTLSSLPPTPSLTLLSQLLIHDAAQKQREFSVTLFDCGVCCVGWLGSECVQLPECGHIFCQACLSQICKMQITEGNVRGVTCPETSCKASPTPAQVRSLVGEELFSRYDRLLLQSTLDLMSDVTYCPRRSCGSPVIVEKSHTAALCSVCRFPFCVGCRKTYHGAQDCQKKKSLKDLMEADLQQGHVDVPQSQGARGK